MQKKKNSKFAIKVKITHMNFVTPTKNRKDRSVAGGLYSKSRKKMTHKFIFQKGVMQ